MICAFIDIHAALTPTLTEIVYTQQSFNIIYKKLEANLQSESRIAKLNQEIGKQTGKGQRHEGGYERDRGDSLTSTLTLGCRGTKGDQVTGQKCKTEPTAVIYTHIRHLAVCVRSVWQQPINFHLLQLKTRRKCVKKNDALRACRERVRVPGQVSCASPRCFPPPRVLCCPAAGLSSWRDCWEETIPWELCPSPPAEQTRRTNIVNLIIQAAHHLWWTSSEMSCFHLQITNDKLKEKCCAR